MSSFAWPVTRQDAQAALADFVEHRLRNFGRYQDAMRRGEPWLYHSLLSAALNLKLLDPREVIEAAIAAYRAGKAPLAAVEGFVRQILGWREFIRGVYWLDMPAMAQANHFGHWRSLPAWYWTGATQMACLREAIRQTLEYGYAHPIQRLMLTGMFGVLAEIEPKQVADWYLAVYVGAVEWVELPNVISKARLAGGSAATPCTDARGCSPPHSGHVSSDTVEVQHATAAAGLEFFSHFSADRMNRHRFSLSRTKIDEKLVRRHLEAIDNI